MGVNHPFQTLFAVHMTCESCVKDVSDAVQKLGGITKVDANLKDQLVSIEGTAAPSAIVDAIQATGRDAILRGSGSSDSAAVSILETYQHLSVVETPEERAKRERQVRGLARMVQVSPEVTLVDLTVRGVSPGSYQVTIREYGNLTEGVESAGPVWAGSDRPATNPSANGAAQARGFLGTVQVGKEGHGSVFMEASFQVWEVIGHAMIVSPLDEAASGGKVLKNDADTVAGIIARSAGVWGNDKTVCACSGKTLWEERKDEIQKGMF
ncbi:hypothetical protein MCOR25_010740 [Pyricularia grisea]|uniref:Superoxide dismutase 1 copper chaperone n=1 Tax=Pyricularia grisea TaxID=148305 RepID=A0A6P8ASI0_PYRGI|nr:uncharacterized protein PgNI_09436 [Pyricularia grisea]KAI6348970.1 hypothetical protein MCOR25_010740 [Pyricularia grisea]TLD05062.1 hypothetical protein PgNI_09436 [Pyricularia grisea]